MRATNISQLADGSHRWSRRRSRQRRGCGVLVAIGAVLVALLPTVAQAEPVLTTASTTTTKVPPGGSTRLEGLSITDSNPEDVLQVTVSTDIGTLTLPDNDGLTLAYGNTFSGDSSITGAHVTTRVRALGSSVPVVIGGSRAHRAPNRRVVVRITQG